MYGASQIEKEEKVLFAFSSDSENRSDALALQKGLLLGDDEGFSPNFQLLTRLSGVSHLVAASGSNLSLVEKITSLGGLIDFWNWSRWAVPAWMIGYYLWTGGSPSLWRATIFWGTQWFGKFFLKRPVSLATQLKILFAGTFLFNPDFTGQIGFILSLSAILGLHFSRHFLSGENSMQLFQSHSLLSTLAEYFVAAWSVVLFVSPWTWWFFGTTQFVGVVTTWLLEPIIVPAILTALFSFPLTWFGEEEIPAQLGLFIFRPFVAVLLFSVWVEQLRVAQWFILLTALLALLRVVQRTREWWEQRSVQSKNFRWEKNL
jgi:predicted membrane metal-binding protein